MCTHTFLSFFSLGKHSDPELDFMAGCSRNPGDGEEGKGREKEERKKRREGRREGERKRGRKAGKREG